MRHARVHTGTCGKCIALLPITGLLREFTPFQTNSYIHGVNVYNSETDNVPVLLQCNFTFPRIRVVLKVITSKPYTLHDTITKTTEEYPHVLIKTVCMCIFPKQECYHPTLK